MKTEEIKINESNYQDYKNLDIVAFSYAHGGAMGDPGGIEIVGRNGQLYYTNYFFGRNYIKKEHVKDIIPIYGKMKFGIVGCQTNDENWVPIDLGFGNYLVIRSEISDDFNREVEAAHCQGTDGTLYTHWFGIVLKILKANY